MLRIMCASRLTLSSPTTQLSTQRSACHQPIICSTRYLYLHRSQLQRTLDDPCYHGSRRYPTLVPQFNNNLINRLIQECCHILSHLETRAGNIMCYKGAFHISSNRHVPVTRLHTWAASLLHIEHDFISCLLTST